MAFYLCLTLMDVYVFINHYSGRFWRWSLEEIPTFLHVCSLSLKSQFPHCHFYFYTNNEWNMISFFSTLLGFIFFIYTSFSLFLIIFFYCNFIFRCQCFVYRLPAHSSAFVCYGSFQPEKWRVLKLESKFLSFSHPLAKTLSRNSVCPMYLKVSRKHLKVVF